MISTTPSYMISMLTFLRWIHFQVLVDWSEDDSFSDESYYVASIVIEKSFTEPLGGFSSAQCDINFSNVTDRYTPKPQNN